MPINDAHWTVDRSNGNIRYIGGDHDSSPSYATVIQFHRWLQDLADDAVAVGDDELDITNTDPSRRSTDNIITLINGYNITDHESEHLYDGSVIQDDGDTIYDGIVNFGNADVQIQIHQNSAVLSDDWWNYGGAGLNPDATAGISHRFMIKVRTGGSDIDGRRLIGTCRRYTYTYSEFVINSTSRGNNVLALTDTLDLNNETAEATVSGYNLTNTTEGYANIDVDANGTDEYYYSEWDRDTQTINDLYEYMKYLTRDGATTDLYGLNGELFRGITHQLTVSGYSGTFNAYEPILWGVGSTYGTGQMLAIDSTTAPSTMWLQHLTGAAPTQWFEVSGVTSSARASTGVTTARTISKPFCGQSTGSALIGAYGYGVEYNDLTSSDKVTDLTDTVITPPNNVENTVGGLISGQDRVLVAPWDGTSYDSNGDPAIDKDQLSLDTALTSENETQVEITESIPADTPGDGYIRVTDNNGFERRLHYQDWENGTPNRFYNIDTSDGNEDFNVVGADATNDVYIAYIDELATSDTATFTSIQSGTRNLVVIVRDGGGSPIRQFISAWSQTSSDQTINAIRQSDA